MLSRKKKHYYRYNGYQSQTEKGYQFISMSLCSGLYTIFINHFFLAFVRSIIPCEYTYIKHIDNIFEVSIPIHNFNFCVGIPQQYLIILCLVSYFAFIPKQSRICTLHFERKVCPRFM